MPAPTLPNNPKDREAIVRARKLVHTSLRVMGVPESGIEATLKRLEIEVRKKQGGNLSEVLLLSEILKGIRTGELKVSRSRRGYVQREANLSHKLRRNGRK